MCGFLKISRAAYYAWVKRSTRPDTDDERMRLIEKAYKASHRTYGYRRVQIHIAQKYGVNINHKAVLRLMNKLGVHSIARKRKFLKKYDKLETYHRYPNHLNRGFTTSGPNQKWVTDITFIHTQQGWAFLSTIKDLYDGVIVAHHLARQNSLELVLKTLKQAIHKEMVTDELILHSAKGINTLPSRILPSLKNTTLRLLCPGVVTVGIMLLLRISSVT